MAAFIDLRAEADWLVEAHLSNPTHVSVNQDRILVFANDEFIELAPDGVLRGGKSYETKEGDLQMERAVSAREGFILTGIHTPAGIKHRPTVIRLNAAGDVQCARSIEADFRSFMTVAAETTNGDIVVATRAADAMLLVKFSANGETKWSRVLDRTDVEDIKALIPTSDGGILAITAALTRFAALTRLDADGKILWDRVLGSADAGFGFYDAVELPDGGFIAAGRTRIYSTNNRQGWLARLSASGDVSWQKTFGGDGEDGLFAIARSGANELSALGGTTSAGNGDFDTWIVTVNADGVVTREIVIGSADDSGPKDPYYAVVADSENGEVVFASPTGPWTTVIGRLRTASSACKLTRAIRTQERVATSTPMEVTLVARDFAPVIRPLAISVGRFGSEGKALCQWSGTETPPVVQSVAVEAADEESIFADGIAELLIQRNFRALDESAIALRSARSSFDSGRSKLRAFYEALGRHATLVSLGDVHRRLLDEWRTATGSATSRIALASQLSAAAERVRGAGFFNTVLHADAERHSRLNAEALQWLSEAERDGSCDAACNDLAIRTAKLGGWSEPLKKLHAQDPTYWEAFAPATLYLAEIWGGPPGAAAPFLQSAFAETKEELGDTLYAQHHAQWQFGIIHINEPVPPPPDWPRMRNGFRDFQRLHPKSRHNAQKFAAAAYRVARDRDTARALFKTPLLSWAPALNAWRDRAEYERAKAWALGEPVEPFVKKLAEAAGGSRLANIPRLVASAQVVLDDDAMERTHAFLVAAPSGPRGVTVTRNAGKTKTWTLDAAIPLDGDAVAVKGQAGGWATFTPPSPFTKALHAMTPRTAPVATGDRLFIVACSTAGRSCAPRVLEVRATAESPVFGFALPDASNPPDPDHLAGAPALDDYGAVAGVVMPYIPGARPTIVSLDWILRQSAVAK